MPSLTDVIVNSAEEIIRFLVNPISRFIRRHGDELLELIVQTPNPDSVFARPSNGGWPAIYEFHWETMVPLSLLLWGLMIGLIILLESTSYLFSNYHRTKLKKRAFSGLLGILSWWWIASLSLRFIDGLSGFLVPSLSNISLFDTLSFGALGVLGLALTLTVDLTLFLILALVYMIRQVVLYLFVLMMPLLIVFWVPGVGPFSLASQFMKRLARFYVPFLFMTVPVALLLRLGQLLGSSVTLSIGGAGQWLLAILTPLVAVISPFILFWQAGALFFMADSASRHASRDTGKARVETARSAGATTKTGTQNLNRGLQGKPAVKSDGQAVLGSGDSRAHAAGTRLNSTATSLKSRFSTETTRSETTKQTTDSSSSDSRNNQFESLRDRNRSSEKSPRSDDTSEYPDDDRPWYIN
ncbi:hypothetical protein NDI56_14050 [Haloarcula sp. S1CR25-12]|uniref:Uncharacterized protein n=1 Tax=Haloarcula saliterrae TaxID=2950534 RepID=A0ABU2FE45_9EURY|nr:hypothetical protein [Haloarcula sp. S1CR25-12]MDS0260524.1 hypothetical protein [Haloarcula sp. S1CR25-12]